jgi:hypothetical protein
MEYCIECIAWIVDDLNRRTAGMQRKEIAGMCLPFVKHTGTVCQAYSCYRAMPQAEICLAYRGDIAAGYSFYA